jgi:CRP-like cAMP-binding protein
MKSELILQTIRQQIVLDEAEIDFLFSVLIPRPFKQGELIVKNGEPARYLLFANAGYLMTYYTDSDGADHVIQFTGEGWWSGDLYSFSDEPFTAYSTKALSAGEALLLPRSAHMQLLETYPKFERYFRIIFQKGVLRQQRRYIEAHATSAEERYQSFVRAYPNLARDIPQKYIASYLGITPEFLSKIRSRLANQRT